MRPLPKEDKLYHYLRASPLSIDNRELVQVTEQWLGDRLDFPPISSLKMVFKGVDEDQWYLITILGGLVSNINKLTYRLNSSHIDPRDRKILKHAVQLFSFEMQRIYSSFFALDHSCWQLYYKRLSDALGFNLDEFTSRMNQYYIYLLPIDALHELDQKSKNLEYELICQSLQMIIKAIYSPSSKNCTKISDLQIALRLTKNINLPGYENWVWDLMTKTP